MFTLDFTRPSDLESLLRAGVGFHLWHKTILVFFPSGPFLRGCKCSESDWKLVIGDWEKEDFCPKL
jgi:hypothetical protein